VPFIEHDEPLAPHIEAMTELVRSGELVRAVEAALTAVGISGSAGKEERAATPLLEKFTRGLKGQDIDQLARKAKSESESRII
jgi:hypothetical protein